MNIPLSNDKMFPNGHGPEYCSSNSYISVSIYCLFSSFFVRRSTV